MTKETREKWGSRVQAWRESGLSAEAFAVGKGFAATSLRTAAVELERGVQSRGRSGRATPKTPPRFLPVVAAGTSSAVLVSGAELVVEVGTVRIRIARGADLDLVGDLIRELQRGAR